VAGWGRRSEPPGHQPEAAASGAVARTDAELLAGSRADFGVLFDRHALAIYRYCARRIGPDEADDVVAETFTVSYERRGRFDGSRDSALPWLYGIATNVLHRHRGAEARRQRLLARLHPEANVDGLADRAAERIDADALIRAVAGELGRIPRRHRDVLFLYANGLDYADISIALGVPIGTVKSRLSRTRNRLRDALARLELDMKGNNDDCSS
jgi:RNA polymerase sigma-70 factor (ECF subfamily)